jgi:hypothetical protein
MSFLSTIAVFSFSLNETDGSRSAYIKASIIHGLIIAISTELLSINKSLTLNSIVLLWSLMTIINTTILFVFLYSYGKKNILIDKIQQKIYSFKNLRGLDKIQLITVIAVLIICLITALVSPPNNYDSMTYHMARVMHWIQNQTVNYYPTNNLRQISFPPGTAYIVTHLQILSGGDHFANCVQWLAFLGCIITTSLIVKNAKIGLNSQVITALVCASIPMAIMQSTTTQTDLTTSFWLISFVYFIFRTDKYVKLDIFWFSTSLGLAILSKPTAIIFGTPFLIILVFRYFVSLIVVGTFQKIYHSMIFSVEIVILTVSLSIPSYLRNYAVFGNLLGIDTGTRNDVLGIAQLTSNLLRNSALNLPFRGYWKLVGSVHDFFNIDINDSVTTFLTNDFNVDLTAKDLFNIFFLPNEDFVSTSIHFILILIIIAFLIYIKVCKIKTKFVYEQIIISTIFGFIFYSLLLKWQVWGNRLLLPFFIINAPVIGYFIRNCLSKSMEILLSSIFIFTGITYSLTPMHHPFISIPPEYYRQFPSIFENRQSPSIFGLDREDIYFSAHLKGAKDTYNTLADRVIEDNCNSIGIYIGGDTPEYPLWVLMQSKGIKSLRIKHINVQNQSQKLEPEFLDSEMCSIIKIKDGQVAYRKL